MSPISTNALVKIELLEILFFFDKQLAANCLGRNLYKTRGADSGCDGINVL